MSDQTVILNALSALSGFIFSFILEIPVVNTWFRNRGPSTRRLIVLGVLIVAAALIYGAACAGILTAIGVPGLTCDANGFYVLVQAVGIAFATNQATYTLFFTGPKKE
jgi:hypothetical protein